VVAALVDAGATCHVACFDEAEAQRFRLRAHNNVRLAISGNLADEGAVKRLYQSIAPLWASIHIAGGFAAGPLRDSAPATPCAAAPRSRRCPAPAGASSM
jgi:hypothetical protein